MNYARNPIVDGFLLSGYHLSQLQHGFRWMPETLVEEIELMESVAPCMHCNVIPQHGWTAHATINHCDNLEVQHDYLKAYRLSSGMECQLCNISYANQHERMSHIRIHLSHRWLSYHTIPIYKVGDATTGSIVEEAIKLKSYLHYHFYPTMNLRLFLMVPSWLRGGSVKEKLRNIDQPTYIPVTIAGDRRKHGSLFTPKIHMHYDEYSTILYEPSLDEKFNGVCQFHRSYGKLMIRLLASLRQTPEAMRNIHFMLYKKPKQPLFICKYLVHVTDEDIEEVVQDVLTKKRTVICCNDLYDEDGCVDPFCMSLVHFRVNFNLEKEATHPLDRPMTLSRHDKTRYGLGKFELIENPAQDLWITFANEIIRKKKQELDERTPFFVYVVLCTHAVDTTEMPTLQNVADFYGGDEETYSAYVGYSFCGGLPKAHFSECLNRGIDETNSDMEEDDNSGGDARLVGTTELTKAIYHGKNALYILRQYLEDTYEDAVKLEAFIQLYKKLSEENGIENPFKFINKRLELSALSFLTVSEIGTILRMIELNLPLLYESPEALEVYLRDRNLADVNWGILKKPFFMSELKRLPI